MRTIKVSDIEDREATREVFGTGSMAYETLDIDDHVGAVAVFGDNQQLASARAHAIARVCRRHYHELRLEFRRAGGRDA